MSSQEQGKAPPTSALDSALSEIQGPKAMSTITKSSIDWDNFKEMEGIEEELETAGQDGYAAVARSLLVPQLLMLGGALRVLAGTSRNATSCSGATSVASKLRRANGRRNAAQNPKDLHEL